MQLDYAMPTDPRPPGDLACELPEDLRRELPKLRQSLARRYRNRADVESEIQEALLCFWKRSKVVKIASPVGYFYTIVRSRLDRAAVRWSEAPVRCDSEFVEEASEGLFKQGAYTEDPLERHERQLAYEELIAPAPENYRAVLRMHFIEELSDEEIARKQGISPRSIGKYIQRGLTYCRQIDSGVTAPSTGVTP